MVNKRIILVANSTWNIYNFRLNIISRFLQMEWQVDVIAPVDEYLEYLEKYPEVTHWDLRHLDRDGRNPVRDVMLIWELYNLYKKIKPDVVLHYTHKPNIMGAVAAKMAGVKSIAVVTGLGYSFLRRGWLNRAVISAYRWSAGGHSHFLFENHEDKELFEELKITTDDKADAISGCGVDIDFFHPSVEETQEETIFLFVGRLMYDKGIEEYARAARLLKEKEVRARFWLIGEFDEENPATIDKQTLLKYIEGKFIEYFGFAKDVRPFISRSSCIVLPSYREGMPKSLLEAMAMAKPVITTRVAGCNELMNGLPIGFQVPAKTVDELAVAMEEFIGLGKEERSRLGQNARTRAMEAFDHSKIARQISDIVVNVVANPE